MRPPSFDLKRIFDLRSKIEKDMEVCRFIGHKPVAETFEDFVHVIHEALPASAEYTAVYDSLLPYAGAEINTSVISEIAWRLAANMKKLRGGIAVHAWKRQIADEWVPVQVTGTRVYRNKYNKVGAWLTMRVLAGSCCMQFIESFWSRKFCHYFAPTIGFTNRRGPYPLLSESELTNMRFLALISAEKSKEKLYPEQYMPFSSGVIWNKKVLKWRTRSKDSGHECPKNYKSVKCYQCEVGYINCKAAVHRQDFIVKFCEKCKTDTLFNPESPSTICFNCTNRMAASSKLKGDSAVNGSK
jgi:hypothetical protein